MPTSGTSTRYTFTFNLYTGDEWRAVISGEFPGEWFGDASAVEFAQAFTGITCPPV